MSQHVLPLLFLNMGGEMNYILDQRLEAQNIGTEKSAKVRKDILHAMFTRNFLEALFRPQDTYSRRSMRAFFEKLAHASIMRLNENSMDKLYDLMTMGVKYQVHMCTGPEQILIVTLNHLDGMRQLVAEDKELNEKIDFAYQLLMENFGNKPLWEWALIRANVINFFQDARVKVSILMRENRQLEDGRFILQVTSDTQLPVGAVPPGTVRYFEEGEMTKTDTFPVDGNFVAAIDKGNTECRAEDRGMDLGHNMYKLDIESAQIQGGGGVSRNPQEPPPGGDEMKLLSRLITGADVENLQGGMNLSLFNDENEERVFQVETEKAINILRIDASKAQSSMSSKMKEMNLEEEKPKKKKTKGEDLLELLDEAATQPVTSKQRDRSASASAKAKPPSRGNSAKRTSTTTTMTTNNDTKPSVLQRGNSGKARAAAETGAAKPAVASRAESAKVKRPSSLCPLACGIPPLYPAAGSRRPMGADLLIKREKSK